jgi:hypothetical protein
MGEVTQLRNGEPAPVKPDRNVLDRLRKYNNLPDDKLMGDIAAAIKYIECLEKAILLDQQTMHLLKRKDNVLITILQLAIEMRNHQRSITDVGATIALEKCFDKAAQRTIDSVRG